MLQHNMSIQKMNTNRSTWMQWGVEGLVGAAAEMLVVNSPLMQYIQRVPGGPGVQTGVLYYIMDEAVSFYKSGTQLSGTILFRGQYYAIADAAAFYTMLGYIIS